MGFPVQFYTFSKRENSTARPPAETGREFSCVIRTESGITSPHIELDLPLTENPSQYNYAYIPIFGRYYNVEDWVFAERLWAANLSVDVLATAKTEIGAYQLYVLRAAADYDGRVIDTYYPTKTGCILDAEDIAPYFTLTGGMYSVGVVSKSANFGSIKYFLLTQEEFATIAEYLTSDTLLEDYDFRDADASWELQKSLIDPLQYIKSCVYIPIAEQTIIERYTDLHTVSVFNWDVWKDVEPALVCPVIKKDKTTMGVSRLIPIPKHPQTVTRGNFVNQRPYTNLQVFWPPFGVIDIDTTLTCNAENIELLTNVDMLTGVGILTIRCVQADDSIIILNRIEAQVGVPVQLSQVTRDYIGTVTAAAGGIASFFTGGISSGISAIGEATKAIMPRSQTIGSGGAYAQLAAVPRLEAQFFEIVDDDITQNGRPLCEMRTPASLGGYMLIQDGDVPTALTATENRKIKEYLESGFYYE